MKTRTTAGTLWPSLAEHKVDENSLEAGPGESDVPEGGASQLPEHG